MSEMKRVRALNGRADYDAVVVGAGHNGLVAANHLAQRGWSVKVLEANDEPGGAVRSGEITEPGFISDRFSAFYPLAAASPVIQGLRLEEHGVRWRRAELPVAHPAPDGRCALLSLDIDETAASMDAVAPGDGEAWRRLYAYWERVGPAFIDALLSPFPPVRGGARSPRALGPGGIPRFVRFSLVPVRQMAEDHFRGEGGGWLLAGNALHADLTPETNGGGLFGWVLCGLGQQHGFPVAGGRSAGDVARVIRRPGRRRWSADTGRVERVMVAGRAGGGRRTVAGDEVAPARRRRRRRGAALFRRWWGRASARRVGLDLHRFQYDNSTVKLDWSLDGPIPWASDDARRAGTVHLADDMDGLTRITPTYPGAGSRTGHLVLGQTGAVEPTRLPPARKRLGLHPRTAEGEGRRRRRASTALGRRRNGGLRRPDRGRGRAPCAGLPNA